MRLLTILLILTCLSPAAFSAGSASPPLPNCGVDLLPGPVYRLGIGVLMETRDGSLVLGLSPYAGSVHNAIVTELSQHHVVKQILWMGEIRYSFVSGMPLILEANETSGFYNSIRETGIQLDGRHIPARNSFEHLPAAYRAPEFKGIPFDPANMRLAPELQDIEGDVRHTIGNSLQVLSSVTQLVSLPRGSEEQKRGLMALFQSKHAADLALVRWLVVNLFEDGRITAAEMQFMGGLINAYSKPTPSAAEIAATDLQALDQVMQKLSKLVNPLSGQMRVDLYKLR